MPLYVFARFEPLPGKEQEVRAELERVLEPTRGEPGCRQIHLYESVRGPLTWYIHSEWMDEAAFEVHTEEPHTVQFVRAMEGLIRETLRAVRTKVVV